DLAFAFAAVLAVAVGGFVWAERRHTEPTVLRALWNGHEVRENAELSVPTSTTKPLEFSDGSRVVFDASSRAKLSRLGPKRALLRLDEGRFVASIVHHPDMTWGIDAGPYSVEVVGTKFSVGWRGEPSTLRVDVTE